MFNRRIWRRNPPLLPTIAVVVLAPLSTPPTAQHVEMALSQMRQRLLDEDDVVLTDTRTSGRVGSGDDAVDLAALGLQAFTFTAVIRGDR